MYGISYPLGRIGKRFSKVEREFKNSLFSLTFGALCRTIIIAMKARHCVPGACLTTANKLLFFCQIHVHILKMVITPLRTVSAFHLVSYLAVSFTPIRVHPCCLFLAGDSENTTHCYSLLLHNQPPVLNQCPPTCSHGSPYGPYCQSG